MSDGSAPVSEFEEGDGGTTPDANSYAGSEAPPFEEEALSLDVVDPPPAPFEGDVDMAELDDAASVASSRRRGREFHADTVPQWGPFYLTFSVSPAFPKGRWQAKCPYHQKNPTTRCTRNGEGQAGSQ